MVKPSGDICLKWDKLHEAFLDEPPAGSDNFGCTSYHANQNLR